MGLTYTRILGIDPGVATGGIALLNLTSMTVSVGKIPAIVSNTLVKKGKRRGLMKKTNTTDVIALSKIFKNLVLTTRPICFLEKVQGWGGLDAGAKQYSIDKMKAHFNIIRAAVY